MRKSGTAVVDFLPRIPAGLSKDAFMDRLENDIETTSNRLMSSAGLEIEEA
jgi:1-acyl-sn-glycerol-3-phosphate acyltransferase